MANESDNQSLVKGVDSDILNKFVETQLEHIKLRTQELSFQKEELEFQKQESNQGFEFAKKSLDCNSEDLKTVRSQEGTRAKYNLVIVLTILVFVFATVLTALLMGKEQLLLAITEKVAYMIGGGGLVLIYGKIRKKNENAADEDEEDDE